MYPFDNHEIRQTLTGYLSEYEAEFIWPSNENKLKYANFVYDALAARDFKIAFWLMSQAHPNVDPFVVFDPVLSAQHGIVSALKWCFESDNVSLSLRNSMLRSALENSQYEVCEWLCANGATFEEDDIEIIEQRNDVRLMSLIKWNEGSVFEDSVYYGHINCLHYAHTNGFSWNEYICSAAATGGKLNCLVYARNNGCPWNVGLFPSAIDGIDYCLENKDYNNVTDICICMEYARKHGCPES